jgi:Ca2+-binding EF-hand superfamily protein
LPVNWKTITTPTSTPNQQKRRSNEFLAPFTAHAPIPTTYLNSEEDLEYSLNYERCKIEAIFLRIDKDGNGRIHAAEFKDFLLNGLHLDMEDKEINLVFSTIDKRHAGCVGFDDFYEYFIRFVLDTQSSEAEDKIRSAFLHADRTGTGTIDFREFSDFVWARKQSMTSKSIASIFNKMDAEGKDEVSFDEFRSFLIRHDSLKALAMRDVVDDDDDDESITTEKDVISSNETPSSSTSTTPTTSTSRINQLEETLRNMYDNADASDIVTYLRQRWQTLVNFKRLGSQGDPVLTGSEGMVADVLPGVYTLLDLACFSDLPPIVPHHVEIKGVQWVSSTMPGLSGKLIFPEHFDGRLPVDIASNEHLAYYGCSLADSSQMKVRVTC